MFTITFQESWEFDLSQCQTIFKTFETDVSNVLKQSETLIFDGSTASIYREIHFCSFLLI